VDNRQPLAWTVLASSIWQHASEPVSITPLVLNTLPIKRHGLTEFTYSRFLVPWLCQYQGAGLFLDADMVVTGDVVELFNLSDMNYDVMVVQDQPRFEWASMMLFSNARCRTLTPEFIENKDNNPLDLTWAKAVGELPREWNACCGYVPTDGAKLLHFTKGIPCWPETIGLAEDEVWNDAYARSVSTVTYEELMGRSIHNKLRKKA
jgi:hypothetical protein